MGEEKRSDKLFAEDFLLLLANASGISTESSDFIRAFRLDLLGDDNFSDFSIAVCWAVFLEYLASHDYAIKLLKSLPEEELKSLIKQINIGE